MAFPMQFHQLKHYQKKFLDFSQKKKFLKGDLFQSIAMTLCFLMPIYKEAI